MAHDEPKTNLPVARTQITTGLVIQKNDFAMGEQPMVMRDAVTGNMVEVFLLIDEKGNVIRPLQNEGQLDVLVDEMRQIRMLLEGAL